MDSEFQKYASFHQTPGNQFCHSIGVPMITLTLLGMFSHLPIYQNVNAAWLLIFFPGVRYCWKAPRLGLPFILILLGLYQLSTLLSWSWLIAAFLVGWAFQFLGHFYFEKNTPALFGGVRAIFVAPLWIFAKWTGQL